MNLSLYQVQPSGVCLQRATDERAWLPDNANRCPPIRTANAHGLTVLGAHDVRARWYGGDKPSGIDIWVPDEHVEVASAFGHGLLTFYLPWVARVPPGYVLRVSGPVNNLKDGIAPLEALVENTEATFTANWVFTRPGAASFKAGEPIATLSIVPAMDIESVDVNPIEAHAALHQSYTKWSGSRCKLQEARA